VDCGDGAAGVSSWPHGSSLAGGLTGRHRVWTEEGETARRSQVLPLETGGLVGQRPPLPGGESWVLYAPARTSHQLCGVKN